MPDSRDDYREVDRPPEDGPPPDPTGLRTHDRILIAGCGGLFISVLPVLVALIYLGRPERWTASDAFTAFGIAGLVMCPYLGAGTLLVSHGARSKPVQGDAVRVSNLLVVGPLVAVAAALLVLPFAGLVYVLVEFRQAEPMLVLQLLTAIPLTVLQVVVLIRGRRRIIPALLAWLDPTE